MSSQFFQTNLHVQLISWFQDGFFFYFKMKLRLVGGLRSCKIWRCRVGNTKHLASKAFPIKLKGNFSILTCFVLTDFNRKSAGGLGLKNNPKAVKAQIKMTSSIWVFIICAQDQAYYLYQLLCMHKLRTRVGFSCKTKARGMIRHVTYLSLQGGRRTGLIESKYRWLYITLQLWRACIHPGFIFDSSLSMYAKIENKWKGRKRNNKCLQPFWECSKAILSHLIFTSYL